MRWLSGLALSLVASVSVAAEPVYLSLRPTARPSQPVDLVEQLGLGNQVFSIADTASDPVPDFRAVPLSLRPKMRSKAVDEKIKLTRRMRRKGAVCGDLDIQGDAIGRVPGRIRGCGIQDAVKVRSVSGVKLSTPATMDCTTAGALKNWIEKGMQPAIGRRGGGVTEIRVMASYACRTRNSQKGARISEHGKGRAIDIGAFTLANGDTITVLRGWSKGREGKILKKMHSSACGTFGTVLGPNSDRFHRDHFHFDTARYRNGSYCR